MDPQNQAPENQNPAPDAPNPAPEAPQVENPVTETPQPVAPETPAPVAPEAPAAPVVPAAGPVAAPADDTNPRLVLAIVALIVGGFNIFGILAVVFSFMTKSALEKGDLNEARSKSKLTKIMSIIGIVLGVLSLILFIILLATGVFAASTSYSTY